MSATIKSPLTILRLRQVKDRTGLSRSAIYSRISTCDFPPSIALGPRAVGWIETDIANWIEGRIQASRTEAL